MPQSIDFKTSLIMTLANLLNDKALALLATECQCISTHYTRLPTPGQAFPLPPARQLMLCRQLVLLYDGYL